MKLTLQWLCSSLIPETPCECSSLGNVYLETGMNEKGLFIELNNGAYSDPSYVESAENTVAVWQQRSINGT